MNKTRKREAILWTIIVVLVLALGYMVTLDLWGLSLWGVAVDYNRFGNWSDAISGFGTTAAVIVALASWLWQRLNQLATDAKLRDEVETSVYHWMSSTEVKDKQDNLLGRLWDIKVQNSTVAPIYHWKMNFISDTDHLCSYLKRPLLPGENVFNLRFLDNVETSEAPEPTLCFEGRSGRIWMRTSRGVVVQTTNEKADCEHALSP